MNHLRFKSGGLIRGGVTDVDEQEPRPIRPQQIALSERSDRRRMGTGRTADPAGQDWRWQAHGDHAGGGELQVGHALDGPALESAGIQVRAMQDQFDTKRSAGAKPARRRSTISEKASSRCLVKRLVSNRDVVSRFLASLRLMLANFSGCLASSHANSS